MSAFAKTSAFAPGWGAQPERLPTPEGVDPGTPGDDKHHLATYDKRHYAAVPLGDLEEAISSLRGLADYAESPGANQDALRTWPESVADDLERHLRG
jgi:hypothetical protein